MSRASTQQSNPANWLVGFSLNRQARHRLELFLREHLQDQAFQLPPIKIYTGRVVSFIARFFQFGAITINRRIFVRPDLFFRDQAGRLMLPGSLLAHEALHVCQYRENGAVKFLCLYLKEYIGQLWRQKKLDAVARMDAYLSISAEVAAREAEQAYRLWQSSKL